MQILGDTQENAVHVQLVIGQAAVMNRVRHLVILLAAIGMAVAVGVAVSFSPPGISLIAVGVLIQAAAVFVLFRQLRWDWITHVGAYFILMATLFHGVNEILVWLIPGQDAYRRIVGPAAVEQFVFLVSVAIFLLTISYVVVLRSNQGISGKPANREMSGTPELTVQQVGRTFDWRVMLAIAAPLVILTLAGNGYYVSPGNVVATTSLGLTAGLANQFLLLALALMSIGFVAQYGRRWILPLLAAQSLAIAIIGQRSEIFVAAGMVLYVLARIGIRLSRRQVVSAVATCVLVVVLITSARAAQGRIITTSGADLRINYLAAGFSNIGSEAFWNEVSLDLGHRFDGNSFGAMELQALNEGYAPLGLAPLRVDLGQAIPSVLLPSKFDAPLSERSEKEYAEVAFNIPLPYIVPGLHEDILPTQLGATIGFGGPWVMFVIAVCLGVIFGAVDRWLLRLMTPRRLLVGIGLMYCVLGYQGSWNQYPVVFRGIVVLMALIWLIDRWHERPRMEATLDVRTLGSRGPAEAG